MQEPASDAKDARGYTSTPWTLPDWEEYSETALNIFAGEWSDVKADVSLDTASSVASTEHQRVYRIHRARQGYTDEKQRDLRQLHSLYTRNRRKRSCQDVSSVRSSANWCQRAQCVLSQVQEGTLLSEKRVKQVENELLTQQSETNAELYAVRRQLSESQDKWKTVQSKTSEVEGETERSGAPTVNCSSPSSIMRGQKSKVLEEAVPVQDDERVAVKQWLLLLTQKLEVATRIYSHEQTPNFQKEVTHPTDVWSSNNDDKDLLGKIHELLSNNKDKVPSLSSWHLDHALVNALPLEVAEHFVKLEYAIASMNASVEQHVRRQMTNFDRAVQQAQGYYHERMQRVVDESLAELKLVRRRYKKKEAQLEAELHTATKEIEQWKQSTAEAEHRKKLDREILEFQLSAAMKKYDHACRRYEDDIAQLKGQLETLRAERKRVVCQHKGTYEVIAQAKKGALALESQWQELKKQHQRTKERHEREVCALRDTVRQLQEGDHKMEAQHVQERQSVAKTLKILPSQKKELEEQVRRGIEQQEFFPENMARLEERHEEVICAVEAEHKREFTQSPEYLDEKKCAALPSVCAMGTKTDLPAAADNLSSKMTQAGGDAAHTQTEKHTRRCRALEKRLNKNFEDAPELLSASRQWESSLSNDGMSCSSVFDGHHDVNASRNSSIHNVVSFRPRVSGQSRALARALLGSSGTSLNSLSSNNKTQFSLNESTLATDDATLRTHEVWDSASFTSIDTVNDLSSYAFQRTTSHQRMRSTQDLLTLARQIKHATASPLDRRRERFESDPKIKQASVCNVE